ncbi:hypothetical protein EG834_14615 [bacterium]|nr:hypothetical protein [bacterium]
MKFGLVFPWIDPRTFTTAGAWLLLRKPGTLTSWRICALKCDRRSAGSESRFEITWVSTCCLYSGNMNSLIV